MKSYLKTVTSVVLCALIAIPSLSGAAAQGKIGRAQEDVPVAGIVLLPGDSKSVEIEYDGDLLDSGCFNVSFMSALIPDDQIHRLSINLTPRGDTGTEIGYATLGAFIYWKDSTVNFLEFLEPRLSYGSESVGYIIDVYPAVSIGVLLSAVVIEYEHFDYPFKVTMTLTLSN